jgi:hypothetical protein
MAVGEKKIQKASLSGYKPRQKKKEDGEKEYVYSLVQH